MEPFPADWRTVGVAGSTVNALPTRNRGAGPGRGGAAAPGRGHRLIAVFGVGAVVTGVLGLAFTLWLAMPRGEVAIHARAAGPGGSGPAGMPAPVLAGASASADVAPIGTEPQTDLVVDVEGAVRRPGIQRLATGSRVGDAIAAAGGYGERADVLAVARTVNLAELLRDGTKVRVPALGEIAGPTQGTPPPGGVSMGSHMPIDLNHANQAELESLPGIGPVTAGKIIDARSAAPFATVDEVATRGVVGPSTLGKLRPLVTVTP